MNAKNVKEAMELIDKGIGMLRRGPFDFYMQRLTDCYDLLIERFAPFKVGDRVLLTRTPEINEKTAPGWIGSKHFLVKGAIGTVREVYCDGKEFGFQIEFDDETWLDRDGKAQPVSQKHTYHFREDCLVAARS